MEMAELRMLKFMLNGCRKLFICLILSLNFVACLTSPSVMGFPTNVISSLISVTSLMAVSSNGLMSGTSVISEFLNWVSASYCGLEIVKLRVFPIHPVPSLTINDPCSWCFVGGVFGQEISISMACDVVINQVSAASR